MKRTFYTAILSFFLCWSYQHVQAQFSWTPHGPDNLGGITHSIVFDGNGALIAGAEGGGLWRSEDQGVSWKRIDAYTGNGNVTSIAVDGNTLYVGTGATEFGGETFFEEQGFPNFDISSTPEGVISYTRLPGGGVYVSTDNGATWSNDNATTKAPYKTLNYEGPFIGIQKVFVRGSRVFVATREGLYYSGDGLNSITKSKGSPIFESSVIYDIEASSDDVILAAGTSTAGDDSLYISTDKGSNFEAVSASAFFDNGKFSFQRIAIAVAPSNPDVVYAAGTRSNGELSGIWRSDDGGFGWKRVAPSGSSGFSPLGTEGQDAFTLEVMPDDPDKYIVAGSAWYTFSSENGHTQTAQHNNPNSNNYLPTKIHCAVFDPNDPNVIFIGTDGPIARSLDGGKTFSVKTKGYETSITYSVAALPVLGREAILSGTPFEGVIYNGNYNRNEVFNQGFGDVFNTSFGGVDVPDGQIEVSYTHPGGLFIQVGDAGIWRSSSFPANVFDRFYGLPVEPQAIGVDFGDGDTTNKFVDRLGLNTESGRLEDRGGAPVTPFVVDEYIPEAVINDPNANADLIQQNPAYIFFCSKKFVWMVQGPFLSGLQGEAAPSWNRITNDLITGTEFLTAIAVSGNSDHTVYVGTSQGNLWRITNATDLSVFDAQTDVIKLSISSTNLNQNLGRWITSIAVDPQNSERVAVTYGGYGGDIAGSFPMVYYSSTTMSAPFFTPISTGIAKEPVYSSAWVVDPATNNSILLIGTESNLYSARNINPGFADFRAEFGPEVGAVPVYDIFVRKYVATITNEDTQDFRLDRDNTIFVATHGRGIWSTISLQFQREGLPGEEEKGIEVIGVKLAPNPVIGASEIALELPEAAEVNVSVYGLDGRTHGQLASEAYKRGSHRIEFAGNKFLPGVYFIRVDIKGETQSHTQTLKAVIAE